MKGNLWTNIHTVKGTEKSWLLHQITDGHNVALVVADAVSLCIRGEHIGTLHVGGKGAYSVHDLTGDNEGDTLHGVG